MELVPAYTHALGKSALPYALGPVTPSAAKPLAPRAIEATSDNSARTRSGPRPFMHTLFGEYTMKGKQLVFQAAHESHGMLLNTYA